MSTRTQKIRLGVFMIFAVLLFVGSVGVLTGIKLLNPKDRYIVRFTESVSGLEVGASVKMKGVRVGQVEKINIAQDVESVEVTLALSPETPITVDTDATPSSIGITGLLFIELSGGSRRAKRVAPNTPKSIIRSGKSVLTSLTGKAESVALKMEAVLNNLLNITGEGNRVRLRNLLNNADRLAATSADMLQENRKRIKRVVASLDRSTRAVEKGANSLSRLATENQDSIRQTLASANSAAGSLERMLKTLRPQATLNAISGASGSLRRRLDDPKLKRMVAAMSQASVRLASLTDELSRVVRHRDRQLGAIMYNLDRASDYLKQFSRAIKERPSLLLRGETLKEKRIP